MNSSDRTKRPIEIGVIGKPHGVRGGVNIYLHNENSDVGSYLNKLFLMSEEGHSKQHELEQLNPSPKGFVAFFKNVATRDEATLLKGLKLCVLRSDLPTLAPDEFYVSDLIGLRATDGDKKLGEIVSCRQTSDIEVVTVRSEEHQIEVPLVEDFVERIDFEAHQILLRNTDDLPKTAVRPATEA